MAQKDTQTRRITAAKLQKAKDALTALSQLTDYNPQRKEYGPEKVRTMADTLKAASDAELAAQNALNKARDAAAKAEWDAYNFVQGAAEQVVGQYGSSSDEYASIGYKKKTEYKKTIPGRKKPAKE